MSDESQHEAERVQLDNDCRVRRYDEVQQRWQISDKPRRVLEWTGEALWHHRELPLTGAD